VTICSAFSFATCDSVVRAHDEGGGQRLGGRLDGAAFRIAPSPSRWNHGAFAGEDGCGPGQKGLMNRSSRSIQAGPRHAGQRGWTVDGGNEQTLGVSPIRAVFVPGNIRP